MILPGLEAAQGELDEAVQERHPDSSQAAIQSPSNGSARFFRIVIK
jgi:hypothetical protein